jgi:hypothetical protein
MTNEATISNLPSSRRPVVRFSLLALFLFVTAACILLAWAVQPRKCVVETLFQISAAPPDIFGLTNSSFNEREFDILRRTQIELIKSDYVLQAALRNPQIAALPVLKSQRDPVTWLHDHLEVECPKDSELLAIRLHCTEGEVPDSILILNGVTSAYQNEVVFADDQSRLVARDALARSLSRLSKELDAKIEGAQKRIDELGKDSFEAKLVEREIDELEEVRKRASASLIEMDMEAEAPKRIKLIQPATARQE